MSCYGNCDKARITCCGSKCINDQTLYAECWKEFGGCYAKCPTTTDFDVDIEGAVVDEA